MTCTGKCAHNLFRSTCPKCRAEPCPELADLESRLSAETARREEAEARIDCVVEDRERLCAERDEKIEEQKRDLAACEKESSEIESERDAALAELATVRAQIAAEKARAERAERERDRFESLYGQVRRAHVERVNRQVAISVEGQQKLWCHQIDTVVKQRERYRRERDAAVAELATVKAGRASLYKHTRGRLESALAELATVRAQLTESESSAGAMRISATALLSVLAEVEPGDDRRDEVAEGCDALRAALATAAGAQLVERLQAGAEVMSAIEALFRAWFDPGLDGSEVRRLRDAWREYNAARAASGTGTGEAADPDLAATFQRGGDERNETCLGCGKHLRNHFGGVENRCNPRCVCPDPGECREAMSGKLCRTKAGTGTGDVPTAKDRYDPLDDQRLYRLRAARKAGTGTGESA